MGKLVRELVNGFTWTTPQYAKNHDVSQQKVYFIIVVLAILGQCAAFSPVCGRRSISQLYQWSVVYFDTPPDYSYDPNYSPNDTFITGVDDGLGKMLLITPRSRTLAPGTLSWVPLSFSPSDSSPLLKPYPNLAWNSLNGSSTDCSSTLISAQRTAKDACNRLWVIDCGIVLNLKSPVVICPPKIVIFDLKTDEMVRVIQIPNNVLTDKSFLINIRLDNVITTGISRGTCDDTYAYIADAGSRAVIVYKSPENSFHTFTHPCMYPDPQYYNLTSEGQTFHFYKGPVGIDVGGFLPRRFFFQSPSNRKFCYIATSYLQSNRRIDSAFLPVGTVTKSDTSVGLYADSADGCVLYNLISKGSIYTWNPNTQIQSQSISNPRLIKVIANYNQANWSTTLAVSLRSWMYLGDARPDDSGPNMMIVKIDYLG